MFIVQIYVDNIIFGATNKVMYKKFAKCMQSEFEMSMMGKLNSFSDYKSSNQVWEHS